MGRTTRTKRRVKEDLWMTIHDLTHKFKVLKDGVMTSHSMSWNKGGNPTGSISYIINTTDEHDSYIRLMYTNTNYWTKEPSKMDYKIELVRKPSNLPNNTGFRWYFRCPITYKLCTLLICTGKYFRSRDPKEVYYDSQAHSKRQRQLEPGYFYKLDELDKQREKFYRGEYRSYYNGKLTKRYLKFKKFEAKTERSAILGLADIERFLTKFKK